MWVTWKTGKLQKPRERWPNAKSKVSYHTMLEPAKLDDLIIKVMGQIHFCRISEKDKKREFDWDSEVGIIPKMNI